MKKAVKELSSKYGISLLSGISLVFAFSPFDIYYLAWVSIAPFLVSLYFLNLRESFKAGIVFGLGYFFGTVYWIYHSIYHYGHVPLVPSILIVLLLSLYLSLYMGLFALMFNYKVKKGIHPALLLAPFFWVSLEYARSYALTGFPWSSIGYSQYEFLNILQVADITGVYGISFVVIAVNGAIADFFIFRLKKNDMPLFPAWPVYVGYGTLTFILILSFVYGYNRLNENRAGNLLRISVVQGSIEQDVKWDARHQREVMNTYMEMTRDVSVLKPFLIVWPETAVPFYYGLDEELTSELKWFQGTLDSYLLTGAITVKNGRDEVPGRLRLANSAVLLDKDSNVGYVYDKIHLVPFGEYVPLKGVFFFLDKLVVGIGDYVSGEDFVRAETQFGSFGTVICYEVVFPGLVRKFFSKGGDFLVTITNDAWFGTTSGPYQHFAMATLRAVENRKPVIRAANSGISGFIDSNGRIISKTDLFERKTLTEDIMTDSTISFYSKYGDLFSYITIVFSLFLLMNLKKDKS